MTRPRSKTRWKPTDINSVLKDAFALELFANSDETAEKLIIISHIVVEQGELKRVSTVRYGGNHIKCCPLLELKS